MKQAVKFLNNIIPIFVLLLISGMLVYAMFCERDPREADVGDFSITYLNEDWTILKKERMSELITLPIKLEERYGEAVYIENVLPEHIHEGMTLSIRSNLEDIVVYIDGEERSSYTSDSFGDGAYYFLPSSFLMVELEEGDAGKGIEIAVTAKAASIINEVRISHGNNIWLSIIQNNVIFVVVAFFMIMLGIASIVAHMMLKKKFTSKKRVLYLGQMMLCTGLWFASESRLRQLIFHKPSISAYTSYLAVGIIGVFMYKYIDEIQRRRYHKGYVVVITASMLQLIINVLLALTGVKHFYETLPAAHFWIFIGIGYCVYCIYKDITTKKSKEYRITAFGLIILGLTVIVEVVVFYFVKGLVLGLAFGSGLIVMLVTNAVQVIYDEAINLRMMERKNTEVTLEAIEVIARTIDAKDKYTGGHSDRVGEYALKLAQKVAKRYHMTEFEVAKISYIARMHDIGKIGIPDEIVNKKGRLTEEEYAIMKSHTEIGYRVLSKLDFFEGLSDGVLYHHERYDGSGYPCGLAGEEIPLVARILCLADSYDAMTTDRVYKEKIGREEVLAELKRCRGTQFDPELTDAFCELITDGEI